MSEQNVRWITSPSWELPFFGLPQEIPWPAEVDAQEAGKVPMDVEHLLEAIERLGDAAQEPFKSFLAASNHYADLGEALEENETAGAIAALDEIDRLVPDSAFVLFHRALLARREGSDEDAVELYRMAAERVPTAPPIWSNLGAVLTMQGQADEAITAFRKALEIFPQDPMALEGLAAQHQLVKLRSADPQYPNAIHFMEPEAFRQMARQQVESMTNAEQLFTYAEHMLREGTAPEVAVRAMERACELQPGQPRWTQALSAAYQAAGQPEEARRVIKTYVDLYPQDLNGWILLGSTSLQCHDRPAAEIALKEALKLDVNSQPALGMLFELGPGEHDPAKQDALAAYGKEHKSWMAYLLAGLIASERGDHRAMLREVEHAYEIEPNSEEVLLHYAQALGSQKELGKLATLIRPAVESGQHTKRLDWHYAHVLKRLNLNRDAVAILRKALETELPPDFKHMVETTMDAWQEHLTGCGTALEVMQAGYLQRALLISLPDGDDGGILLAAGQQLPADATFSWRATAAKATVVLQQGESLGAREPLRLGYFRIRGVHGAGAEPVAIDCHITAMPDGGLHFRATQDGRKLEVSWSPKP